MRTARVPGEIHRSRLTGQFSKHRYHAPKVATFVGEPRVVHQGKVHMVRYEIEFDDGTGRYIPVIFQPDVEADGSVHYRRMRLPPRATFQGALHRAQHEAEREWSWEQRRIRRERPHDPSYPSWTGESLLGGAVRAAGEAVGGAITTARDTLSGAQTFLANPLKPSSTAAIVIAGLVVAGGLYWLTRPKTVTPQPVGPGPAPPPAPAPSGRAIQLTEADAGTTVQAKPGDTVVISLTQDASSGYAWGLVGQPDANVVTTGPAVPTGAGGGDGGVPGGTSMQISFPFYVKGPGTVPLQFVLARPWDPANPSRQITFTIQSS